MDGGGGEPKAQADGELFILSIVASFMTIISTQHFRESDKLLKRDGIQLSRSLKIAKGIGLGFWPSRSKAAAQHFESGPRLLEGFT